MVLTLHRGIYCPKDRQQFHQLVTFSKQCAVGFTRLVSITTDRNLVLLNDLRLGVGADWPFLYDRERVIARDLEIEEYTDTHNKPMKSQIGGRSRGLYDMVAMNRSCPVILSSA